MAEQKDASRASAEEERLPSFDEKKKTPQKAAQPSAVKTAAKEEKTVRETAPSARKKSPGTVRTKEKKPDPVGGASEGNKQAKTTFIVAICLLSPLLLVLGAAILLFFFILFAACALLAGAMTLLLAFGVLGGVVLAMVAIAYGAICILNSGGFQAIAGQYELGLGLAISGITIIVSALLYSGISGLVPFLFRKIWAFAVFVFKKIKEFFVQIYRRSVSGA